MQLRGAPMRVLRVLDKGRHIRTHTERETECDARAAAVVGTSIIQVCPLPALVHQSLTWHIARLGRQNDAHAARRPMLPIIILTFPLSFIYSFGMFHSFSRQSVVCVHLQLEMDATSRRSTDTTPHASTRHEDDERSRKRRINNLGTERIRSRRRERGREIETRVESKAPERASPPRLPWKTQDSARTSEIAAVAAPPRHFAPMPRMRAAASASNSKSRENHQTRPMELHHKPYMWNTAKGQQNRNEHTQAHADPMRHRSKLARNRAPGREEPCGAAVIPSWDSASELMAFKDALNHGYEQTANGSLPDGDWYQIPEHYEKPSTLASPSRQIKSDDSGVPQSNLSPLDDDEKTINKSRGDFAEHIESPRTFQGTDTLRTCAYPQCDERFESEVLLRKHQSALHEQDDTYANSNGPSEGSSSIEVIRCLGVNPRTFAPCNVAFTHPSEMQDHVDTIHKAPQRPFGCKKCREDSQFERHDQLARHYRLRHPNDEVPMEGYVMKSIEQDTQ